MVGYLFFSIVVAILSLAFIVAYLQVVVLPRIRARRELVRRRREIASQDELEEFIRRVDRVTAADELNHLENREDD